MSEHTCQTCAFWDLDQRAGKGACRRMPPVVLNPENLHTIGWPLVSGNQWCGEHSAYKTVSLAQHGIVEP